MTEITSEPIFITGNTYPNLLRGNFTSYRMLGVPKGAYLLCSQNVGILPKGAYVVTTEIMTDPISDATAMAVEGGMPSSAPKVRVTFNNKDSSGTPGPSEGQDITQDFNSFGQTIIADGENEVTLKGILNYINDYLADEDVAKVDFLDGGLPTGDVYTVLKSSSSDTIPTSNIEALKDVFSTWSGRSVITKVE